MWPKVKNSSNKLGKIFATFIIDEGLSAPLTLFLITLTLAHSGLVTFLGVFQTLQYVFPVEQLLLCSSLHLECPQVFFLHICQLSAQMSPPQRDFLWLSYAKHIPRTPIPSVYILSSSHLSYLTLRIFLLSVCPLPQHVGLFTAISCIVAYGL